jgi:biopolymer transport protein ExbB
MIKTLMAVLPLLGLLGTVTGMIQVFDVMAVTGTSNARLMAGGVSAATIPTMAGLVAALSGVYAVTFLENKASAKIEQAEDLLLHH